MNALEVSNTTKASTHDRLIELIIFLILFQIDFKNDETNDRFFQMVDDLIFFNVPMIMTLIEEVTVCFCVLKSCNILCNRQCMMTTVQINPPIVDK